MKTPPLVKDYLAGYIVIGLLGIALFTGLGLILMSGELETSSENGIDDLEPEDADVNVVIGDFYFEQEDSDLERDQLEAEAGDIIYFHNEGDMMHTVTIPEYGIDENVQAGEGVFIQVGEPVEDALVDCTLHGNHEAEITVTGDEEDIEINDELNGVSETEDVSKDVEEISRHPSDMPGNPNYQLYANGSFEDHEPREAGETREIEVHTTFEEVQAEVVDGTTMEYWTFDGTVPGPTFRVKEGDTINWNLHNPENNSHPHNIAIHGASGPGGGGMQTDVAPDGTAEIDTQMLDPGVYIYHCAFPNVAEHIAYGMNGIIIVEPEEGLPEVDHEFSVLQMDFYTEEGGDQEAADLENMGHLDFSREYMYKEEPSFVTFNGRPDAIREERALGNYENEIEPGDDVRVFFGNGGPALQSSYRAAVGDKMDHYGGEFELIEENEETVIVPAGAAKMFEMSFDVPGQYNMYDHSFPRPYKGAWGEWHISGDQEEYDDIFNPIEYDELR